MHKVIHFLALIGFVSSNCLAQVVAPMEGSGAGSEYFVGKELGKPLITVNLLNGVRNPGVYHVPAQTNLPQLLAYAGGSTVTADTTDIRIRRMEHEKSIFVRHDLNAIMNENQPFPTITDKDVVQMREKNNLESTLRWVAIASGIATTLMSAAIIAQIQRNK